MKTDQYRCSLYKINGSFFGKIPHPLNFMALQKSGNFSKANQHQRILKSSICFYLYLSVVSIVFLALLTSCTAGQGSATPTAVPTPIVSEKPTYTVQRGTVTQVVNLTGRVMPSKQQDLSFATSGYVKEVFFKQGDAVKAGDVIARLDGLERYQADIAVCPTGPRPGQLCQSADPQGKRPPHRRPGLPEDGPGQGRPG